MSAPVHLTTLGLTLMFAQLTGSTGAIGAELAPEAVRVWDSFVSQTESRIRAEIGRGSPFLLADALPTPERNAIVQRLRRGEIVVLKLDGHSLRGALPTPRSALLHHWYGAAFLPGATVDWVLDFVQRYDEHARYFDDVTASRLVARDGDRFTAFLKLRRTKVITVHYNTTHDVTYTRLDARRAVSRSVATKITELADPGTPQEREKPAGTDRGFLWRLNSYWRFEARDGGVVIECESLSLSRDIPTGLGWIVGPFVQSVPRESLERTLGSIRRGVGATAPAAR